MPRLNRSIAYYLVNNLYHRGGDWHLKSSLLYTLSAKTEMPRHPVIRPVNRIDGPIFPYLEML
jgi:hypothetical protein